MQTKAVVVVNAFVILFCYVNGNSKSMSKSVVNF